MRRASAVLAAVLVLGGCGGGSDDGGGSDSDTLRLLADAGDRLQSAGTFRLTLVVTSPGADVRRSPGQGRDGPANGRVVGVVDWPNASSEMTVTDLNGGSKPPQRLLVTNGAWLVPIDPAMAPSGEAARRVRGKRWMRITGQASEGAVDMFAVLGNPFTTVDELRSRLREPRSLGSAQVEGVTTTHIGGHLVSLLGVKDIDVTADVWLDGQGRMRRLVLDGHIEGDPVHVQEDFTDFGLPVSIAVPPADQIVDIGEVFAGLGGADAVTPIGDWSLVSEDREDGLSWRVYRTPGSPRGQCLAVETDPDLGVIAISRSLDGSFSTGDFPPAPYKGKPANCGPPTDLGPDDDPDLLLQVLQADSSETTGGGRHYVAGVLSDRYTAATGQLSDGSDVRVTIRDGVFFLTWTGRRKLTQIHATGRDSPLSCSNPADSDSLVTDMTCT